MDDKNIDNTAFFVHHGPFKYMRKPSGLKNASATFQRAIDVTAALVKWQHAILYINDIIILSKVKEDCLKQVDKVLLLLNNAEMSIKLKKCFFSSMNIDYFGHLIALSRLQEAQKTTEATKLLQYPNNLSERRTFLGICNIYLRFVPNDTSEHYHY